MSAALSIHSDKAVVARRTVGVGIAVAGLTLVAGAVAIAFGASGVAADMIPHLPHAVGAMVPFGGNLAALPALAVPKFIPHFGGVNATAMGVALLSRWWPIAAGLAAALGLAVVGGGIGIGALPAKKAV